MRDVNQDIKEPAVGTGLRIQIRFFLSKMLFYLVWFFIGICFFVTETGCFFVIMQGPGFYPARFFFTGT